jgi:hypothetical protein
VRRHGLLFKLSEASAQGCCGNHFQCLFLGRKISLLGSEDIFIAFDFPRYSNDVFKTMRYAKEETGVFFDDYG